jgi:uncharacterized protein GlcG (DUF336 family)
MEQRWKAIAALAAMAAAPCFAQGLVTERMISADLALEAAAGALAQCRKDGHHVSVTVLDRAARTRVAVNDDGANPHSFEHSYRKAYTALTYRQPSGEYGKRQGSNPQAAGVLHLAHITTAAGGLPIRAGKDVVGSIAVSGSPGVPGSPAGSGGLVDEKCAQAGIDRIAAKLGAK